MWEARHRPPRLYDFRRDNKYSQDRFRSQQRKRKVGVDEEQCSRGFEAHHSRCTDHAFINVSDAVLTLTQQSRKIIFLKSFDEAANDFL